MATSVVVYGFETSNNMKVRVALGAKKIAHEFRTIDPADREEVVRISGQHLTPVLVHGDRVLFDSAAILRYLDANFAAGPKLFGSTRDEQWAIEDWELFARTELAGPMMRVVHGRISGHPLDDAGMNQARTDFIAALSRIGTELASRAWLVGESMTAADVTAAAVVHRVQVGALFESSEALVQAFAAVEEWRERVMVFDTPAG